MTHRTYGAYVLPGDPTWLERTLPRYYPLLDDLVVPVPRDGRGWTGTPIQVAECLEIVRRVDTRGLLRVVEGSWTDPADPLAADTAQRQAALDALSGSVDWIVQIDNDEFLPEASTLVEAIDLAEERGLGIVELPMRVLFRRTGRTVLEVVASDGGPRYEYPGPVAVRAGSTTVNARRAVGPFLRMVVAGDERSLQVNRPAEPGETRLATLRPDQAIVHNSWARTPAQIRAKVSSWGHADASLGRYYWTVWWPAPLTWWLLRDFHPFSRGLWPRLARRPVADTEPAPAPASSTVGPADA
ncbi:hypothetical protein LEP48_05875 [Isoptericola sp. NEAU-Y5]|uniref:Glycosyl transferase family 2 n=1 Tax=Isoptericola luteus TaxID=2879484 RepID=A0ABS7ZCW7_9MICO|nr:hypothetical protein [Isoptericola sp. NEAU-Y5]MCA5892883.1 hypothetical protein [Isoptericola sp. NEAU-Y5]